MTYPNKRDCEHGSKRGSCELCDCYERIAELKKQLEEGEALVIELAAALEINQLRNE